MARSSAPLRRLAASCLLLVGLFPALAHGETPAVRLGDLTLKPYVLVQLDEGGTFDQSRRGGQGTGFNLRRARVGARGTLAKQLEFGAIYDFGSTPGGASRLFEAVVASMRVRWGKASAHAVRKSAAGPTCRHSQTGT